MLKLKWLIEVIIFVLNVEINFSSKVRGKIKQIKARYFISVVMMMKMTFYLNNKMRFREIQLFAAAYYIIFYNNFLILGMG